MDEAHEVRLGSVRAELNSARRQHMLAIQRAIAIGVPIGELEADLHAFDYASGQLLWLCSSPESGNAPMVLVP